MKSLTIACLTVGLAAINPTPAAPSAAAMVYCIRPPGNHVVGAIALAGIVAGAAVSTAIFQESLGLQFEITVDGSVVAKPELRVQTGGEGSIAFGEKSQAVVTFTPTVRGDDIDFVFDITDGDKRLRPALRISKTVPGSVEWMSPAHGQKTVRLAVSWVR